MFLPFYDTVHIVFGSGCEMRKNSELVLEVDNASYVAQLHFCNLIFLVLV